MDETAAKFLWILEPEYSNFITDDLNLKNGQSLNRDSFGKFLVRNTSQLSVDQVKQEADKIFKLKY